MLVIRVVSRSGEPPSSPLQAAFGAAGGDIGRGAPCTLVLSDPERRLSRRHAVVTQRDGRHYIRRLGAGAALAVDDRLLAVDAEHELVDGACIRLGPYVLQAVCPPAAVTAAAVKVDVLLGETSPGGARATRSP